jgi:hypothetical protein
VEELAHVVGGHRRRRPVAATECSAAAWIQTDGDFCAAGRN